MAVDERPVRSDSGHEGRLSHAVRPGQDQSPPDQHRRQSSHQRVGQAGQRAHRDTGSRGMTPTIRQQLQSAWVHRPYTVVLAVVLVIPGALAIVYGDEVSQALSNIAAGTISRLMGTLLVVGSALTLTGIARNRALTETLGLTVTAIGCAIYGLGVILGLGLHGAVAGSGFLAIAAGTIRRVITLAAVAREVDRASES
jgi:fumarate reductase subunit D